MLQIHRAQIGGREVLASGSFTGFVTDPVRVFPFPDSPAYFIEFVFTREGNDDSIIRGENYETGYQVVVQRLTGVVGSTITPIYVANYQGERAHLNVAVQLVGSDPETWILTFTLAKSGIPV